jgi:hypothetical protein
LSIVGLMSTSKLVYFNLYYHVSFGQHSFDHYAFMKTPFYIHIGTWKTGSSTIQYNVHSVKKLLQKEGIFYLSKGDKMVVDDGIIRRFNQIESEYVRESREKLSRILVQKLNENPSMRFIASAEEFSGDPFTAFANSGWVAKNLFEITKELNLDIKIIVYIRRQDDFVESMYTQSIHLGSSQTFDEFLGGYDQQAFDWYRLIESYSEVFGKANIIVRRYHKSFLPEPDTIIHQMGEILSSSTLKQFEGTNPRNRGLSRDAIEITRITNRFLAKDDQYVLRNIFQDTNAKQPFESYAYFGPEQRISFLKLYKESNQRLAHEYLGNTEILFPDPTHEELKAMPYSGLTHEALALNLSRGLVTLSKRLNRIEEDMRYEITATGFRYKIKSRLKKIFGSN